MIRPGKLGFVKSAMLKQATVENWTRTETAMSYIQEHISLENACLQRG